MPRNGTRPHLQDQKRHDHKGLQAETSGYVSDRTDPAEAAPSGPIIRDASGRIIKGSGAINPGGRPKGLAARIRALTNDGEVLIQTLLEIVQTVGSRDRVRATEILLERGYGKTVQTTATIALEGDAASAALEALQSLTTGDLERLARSTTVQGIVLSSHATPEKFDPAITPGVSHLSTHPTNTDTPGVTSEKNSPTSVATGRTDGNSEPSDGT